MVATYATPPVDHEVDRQKVDAARLLSRAAVFSGVSASCLAELAGQAVTRYLEAGDHLFREGELGTSMYVLGEGRVRLYVTGADGESSTLAVLSPTSSFGELSVFDGGSRSASAVALERSTVVGVAAPAVRRAYRADPGLAERLLCSLAALVRQATDQRSTLVFHDLAARVARWLLTEAERHDDGRAYVPAKRSGPRLAAGIGGSEAGVRRILRSFEVDRLISSDGAGFRILDPDALAARARD
jgi:CRP/FNR family transcriptional regulator, cyclic AMP receptor protein